MIFIIIEAVVFTLLLSANVEVRGTAPGIFAMQ